jgi:multisubunit Na+/H+ antiporter MnhB subunit
MMGRTSVVLDEADRWLFRVIIVVSLFVLFKGHNAPGGGFAGGLIAGGAFVLRYLAGGALRLRRALAFRPLAGIGLGLFVAAFTTLIPAMLGDPALTSAIVTLDVPIIGTIKLVSSALFDVGVYLLVVGVVVQILLALGSDPLEGRS